MTTLIQTFIMAKLSFQKTRPKQPAEPRPWTLKTPSADEARELMRTWLAEKTTPTPGYIVALSDVVRSFVRWTDRQHGPVVSLWFAQQQRVRRILHDLRHHVAYWQSNSASPQILAIANLEIHCSRAVCQRRLIAERDAPGIGNVFWVPTDYHGPALKD